MARLGDVIIPPQKEGREKHAPHIEAPAAVKAGQSFEVSVIVGKEVHHPNTVGHHIKSVSVYAKEDGARPVVEVAAFDFGPSFAEPKVTFTMKLGQSSQVFALAYCNLHGLWDSSVKVEVK